MTWRPALKKQPERKKRAWASNQEIQVVFDQHMERGYAPNTRRNYTQDVRVFASMWGDTLLTTLKSPDIDLFTDKISLKCAKLQNGCDPACLAGYPLADCPLLREARGETVEYTSCQGYRPLDVIQVWHYLCTLHAFYEWLRENGDVEANPVTGPLRAYGRKHRALFEERRTSPRRRDLTSDEVRLMVTGSPIWHAIAYLLMAKCFLRIHEVAKLRLHPKFCNLKEGWMDIPRDAEKGNKRKGNKRIILDHEALEWLRFYLLWRERKIKRDAAGDPVSDLLMVSMFGQPWAWHAKNNFRTSMHKDAQRVGLMPPGKVSAIPKDERINPHCFREFASTWAMDHDANDSQVRVIRGDIAPGALDRYDAYLLRLPDLYRRFGPKLDLPSPAHVIRKRPDGHRALLAIEATAMPQGTGPTSRCQRSGWVGGSL